VYPEFNLGLGRDSKNKKYVKNIENMEYLYFTMLWACLFFGVLNYFSAKTNLGEIRIWLTNLVSKL